MSKRLIISFLLLIPVRCLFGQTDNIFWFAAPDISSVHGDAPMNGAPINLHITATNATTVTVSQPANPSFTPVTFSLDALEHRTIRLDNIMGIDQIENYPQSLPQPPASIQKKAFKITSDPGDITVYYELDNRLNRDIFPLKGKNALGQMFYVSTQNYFPNGPYGGTAYSGFVVAATENNTRIVIYPSDDWLYFNTNPGDSIVLNLNEGETFAFRSESTAPNRHINGTLVKSDKKIVVTVYDDSMRKSRDNAGTQLSYDTFGDQIIPFEIIGHDYIVMKGQVTKTTFDGGERIFITATKPNTKIYIDGALVTTIANAGGIFNYEINNSYVLVQASEPVYLNHLTGFGGELGGAVLPTIDGCTGSYSVTFTRTPNTNDAFFLNMMARNDTSKTSINRNKSSQSFTIVSGGETTPIPANYFDYILDSTWVVLKKTAAVDAFIASKILPGNEACITNAVARFHLGVINGGSSTGCKYGYFSDYQSGFANAGIGGANAVKQKTYCSFDPIHLVANGGISYKWTCESNAADTVHLSSTRIADPYFSPENSGFYKFKVKVQRECYGDTTLIMNIYVVAGPVAQFEVETATGCSPFNAVFTNLADTALAVQNYWNFDTRHNTVVNQSSLPNPFTWMFPENLTDSIQEYRIRLTVKGDFGMCPNQREKTIRILPNVNAGFTADKNAGCNPLPVHFTDTTTGVPDTLNSYWDFGSYQQVFSHNATFEFENYTASDTVYDVRLIAFTKFGCTDTAVFPVTVHPYINASFAIDNLTGCSPFNALINPAGSIGVDTAIWNYSGGGSFADTAFRKTDLNSFTFSHNDVTQPLPDTIFITMTGMNSEGCADTATAKRLVVYPVVQAGFDLSEDEVCDSVAVNIDNNSTGYNLRNEWDIGDGTSFSDTTGSDFSHTFLNRTAAAKEVVIKLRTISDYFCSDIHTDTITVFPFIDAGFSLDYAGNCSPLNVELQNVSRGGSEFGWDFGDGTDLVTSSDAPIFHIFENNGDTDTVFLINLRAENAYGCADSIQRQVSLYSRVIADFGFTTPDSGCNPLEVSFLNNSAGSNLDYLWDFGDNSFSISPAPPGRIYKNLTGSDTSYYVTLTVSNPAGCDSAVTKPVHVFSKVAADFAIERADSCSPFTIRVGNYSSGGITDLIWKYAPGDSIIMHDLSDPYIPPYVNNSGSVMKYAVELKVNNSHGCTAVKTDSVIVYPEISAFFTADVTEGCQPLASAFTNSTNIIQGTSFTWNFGDGTSSGAVNASHVFNNFSHTADKTFNVGLTAVSEYGCTGSSLEILRVHPEPLADFTYPSATGCPPLHMTFTNNSGGTALTYQWDFDNGETSTQVSPSQVFYNDGASITQKDVTLVATTAFGCNDSVVKPVAVFPGVSADFDASAWTGCNPLEVDFTGNAVNENDYYWYINGDFFSNYQNPFYRFTNNTGGDLEFDVKFSAVSINGCSDDTVKHITVHARPVAEFLADPQVQDYDISDDLNTVRINNMTANRSSWTYNWDFGDGTHSAENNALISKQYGIWGDIHNGNRINLSLTVTNPGNPECSDTALSYIVINPPLPQVEIGEDISGCMPLTVDFPSTVKYIYNDSYRWDFGTEGMQSSLSNPGSFVYDTAGVYIIRLNVSGDGGDNWDYRKVTVYPKPVADFNYDPDTVWVKSQTEEGTPVKFFNISKNGSYYRWDFGDGETSIDFQPAHEYAEPGQYYITLVTESGEGCYDTLAYEIPVVVEGRGNLRFPNAIVIYNNNPADEQYNAGQADPRIFRPVAEGIERYRLEIYNRWGELIFASEDVNKGWNGYIKGSPAKQDVYIWRVTGSFTNGKPFNMAGDLTLLIKDN